MNPFKVSVLCSLAVMITITSAHAGDCTELYANQVQTIQKGTVAEDNLDTAGAAAGFCAIVGAASSLVYSGAMKGALSGNQPAEVSGGLLYAGGAVLGAVACGGASETYLNHEAKLHPYQPDPVKLRQYLFPLTAIKEAQASDASPNQNDPTKNLVTHDLKAAAISSSPSLKHITDQDVWAAVLSLNSQSAFCYSPRNTSEGTLDTDVPFTLRVVAKLKSMGLR